MPSPSTRAELVPPKALHPAAAAFDAVAARFDERFGAWLSVAAQRSAVRSVLLAAFPAGARVLELGGGTGEDARWLAGRGREVLFTDPSPAMVRTAAPKLRACGMPEPRVLAAEQLHRLAEERRAVGEPPLDGAFSNFAALNCVADLAPVARSLAMLLRPDAELVLVLFGILVPGEWVTQLMLGRPRAAVRRLARGQVLARLGGRTFTVRYHRGREVVRAFAPWFTLQERRGVGIAVPPSAAEPWISRHPRLLRALDAFDHGAPRALAPLGDHVLYRLRRSRSAEPVAPAAPATCGERGEAAS